MNLLEEAYQEAVKHFGDRPAQFQVERPQKDITITGNREALKFALSEVLLNALQANDSAPDVRVQLRTEPGRDNRVYAVVEVLDNGPGFTEESARRATERFYSTRAAGGGLGLSVALRVVQAHGGRLEVPPPHSGRGGLVRIYFPVS
jgi:signal transduction histidine kinase